MLMIHAMVGSPLYKASDIWDDHKGGYWAVRNSRLREYLAKQHLLPLFKRDSFGLLQKLLHKDPRKRIDAATASKHPWFEALRNNKDPHVESVHYNEWSDVAQRQNFPYYKPQ